MLGCLVAFGFGFGFVCSFVIVAVSGGECKKKMNGGIQSGCSKKKFNIRVMLLENRRLFCEKEKKKKVKKKKKRRKRKRRKIKRETKMFTGTPVNFEAVENDDTVNFGTANVGIKRGRIKIS